MSLAFGGRPIDPRFSLRLNRALEMQRIEIIDTHTGGEPTRVVLDGGPDLGDGPLPDRRALFRDRFDAFRSAIVNEPRGSDVMVGALLTPPIHEDSVAGVIFFNNVGYLHMCGHGMIGVTVALAYLGLIEVGTHQVETPAGIVSVTLEDPNTVSLENVLSYRCAAKVAVEVPGMRTYVGDVAWGGNWFFLVEDHGERIGRDNVDRLTEVSSRIRDALRAGAIKGSDGGEIDHIELFGPPTLAGADAKNFVLCPGRAYDRSPCGTGTSAKLACLIADGKLAERQVWWQESVIGSVFEGSATVVGDRVRPHIRGTAYVNARATLLIDPKDPFNWGIRS
jgi:4-hydroxyproline epimerase